MGYEIAAMAIIAAASAAMSYNSGQQQKKAAKTNQKIAEVQAQSQRNAAGYQAEQQRLQNRRLLASQRVQAGGSGITQSGSALDVMADSAMQGEMDRLAALYGGEINALPYSGQAVLSGLEAKQAGQSSYWNAGNAFLGKMQGANFSGSSGGDSGGNGMFYASPGYGTQGTTVQGLPWQKKK